MFVCLCDVLCWRAYNATACFLSAICLCILLPGTATPALGEYGLSAGAVCVSHAISGITTDSLVLSRGRLQLVSDYFYNLHCNLGSISELSLWQFSCTQLVSCSLTPVFSQEMLSAPNWATDYWLVVLSISLLLASFATLLPCSCFFFSLQKPGLPLSRLLMDGIDANDTYYVLNPEKNLPDTQKMFEGWFHEWVHTYRLCSELLACCCHRRLSVPETPSIDAIWATSMHLGEGAVDSTTLKYHFPVGLKTGIMRCCIHVCVSRVV